MHTETVKPTKYIDKAPKYRFAAFLIMVWPYILIYAGIQIISSLGSEIMEAFSIQESSLSLLSSVGTLSKALISLLGGALAMRFGGKRVILAGLGIMALCGVMYYFCPASFALLLIIRVIHGCGCGISGACILSVVACWFPKRERGIAQGCLSGFFGLSISLVTVYSYACTTAGMSWNTIIALMLTGGGLLFGIIAADTFKEVKTVYGVPIIDEAISGGNESRAEETAEESSVETRPSCWRKALRSPAFWITGITLFLYGSSSLGVGFIMPLFLRESGFSAGETASIMSIGTASSIIFAVLGGIISDRFFSSRRCECTMIGFISAGLFYLAITLFAGRLSAATVTVLYFAAYGTLHIAAGPAWVLPIEVVAPGFAAQNAGTCQMFSSLGGFLLTNLLGIITEGISAFSGMLTLTLVTLLVAAGAFILKLRYRY